MLHFYNLPGNRGFRFIFPIRFHQKYIRKAMLELESKADIIFKKSLKETKARKANRNMSL